MTTILMKATKKNARAGLLLGATPPFLPFLTRQSKRFVDIISTDLLRTIIEM
jgi:hypothetical protein